MKQILKWIKNTIKATCLLIAFLLISAVTILLFAPLEPIAQRAADYALRKQGLSNVYIKIQHITLNEITLSNVHIGDADNFHINKVNVTYSPSSLWQKRVYDIKINGATLNGKSVNEGEISFGKLDSFIQQHDDQQTTNTKFTMPVLPFNTLAISDSTLKIETSTQAVNLPFSLVVTPQADDLHMFIKLTNAEVKLLNFDIPATGALSISTHFSGTLPLQWVDGGLIIENGELHSNNTGSINFTPNIATTDQGIKLLYDALADYQYKKFTIALNSDKTGKLISGLSLEGNNQSLYDGRDIELNVNLTMNVYDTIKSIMGVYHISDKVKEGLL